MFSLLLALSVLALPAAPIVFTQARGAEPPRIALLSPGGQVRVLSQGFHSAADPEVYFDGTRILFAAKRTQADPYQIFEMNADGTAVRQITHSQTDCRGPVYQSRIFTLDEPQPWDQVAYASDGSLHSVKLDGSGHQQLTFTPSQDRDPLILPDGRMIYASQSRFFGVNLDGTDYALFTDRAGSSPAVTHHRARSRLRRAQRPPRLRPSRSPAPHLSGADRLRRRRLPVALGPARRRTSGRPQDHRHVWPGPFQPQDKNKHSCL